MWLKRVEKNHKRAAATCQICPGLEISGLKWVGSSWSIMHPAPSGGLTAADRNIYIYIYKQTHTRISGKQLRKCMHMLKTCSKHNIYKGETSFFFFLGYKSMHWAFILKSRHFRSVISVNIIIKNEKRDFVTNKIKNWPLFDFGLLVFWF